MTLREERIEAAAFQLYAAGPWGRFEGFRDEGFRAATDAHDMETYRRMAALVLETVLDFGATEPVPADQLGKP